jgi:membrane protease YdiL (CAAX protease family)
VTRTAVSALTLAAAVLGPPLLAFADRATPGAPRPVFPVLLQLAFCAIAAGVLLVVTRVERLPLSSIGIRRPGAGTAVTVVVLAAAAWLLPLLTQPLVRAMVDTDAVAAAMQRLFAMPLWLRWLVAATSGFVEEILYRGYAIERLSTFAGHRWRGAVLAALIFALAHTPVWGARFALAVDLPFGLLMTGSYLWRRDVIANGAVHSGLLVLALCF